MLVVKKFGGSSVADKERIFNVARRCAEEYQMGNDVIVVLSAMGEQMNCLRRQPRSIRIHQNENLICSLPRESRHLWH
jgi:aspartate kinase